MKSENRAKSEQSGDRQSQRELTTDLSKTEGSSNKALELTEDEKVLMNILKDNSPIDLNKLKGQSI